MTAGELERRIDAVDTASDPEFAETELGTLVGEADAAGHVEVAAHGRYALARVLVARGRAEDALGLIEAAELGWRSVGATFEALRTNLGRMHVLDDLGRHDEAATVGRSVADELAQQGAESDDPDLLWLRAAVEENTGVAFGYLGRHAEALTAYASAAACYDRIGADDDSARVALNRGVELCELARSSEAIEVLSAALPRFVAAGDRLNEALCRTNLAEAWIAAGRYLEAFECLDAAASALDGLDHTTDWLRAELARADCLVTLNLDVEALDLFDDLVEAVERAGLKRDLAKLHLGRGIVLARSGFPSDARRAFDSARSLFVATGDRTLLARTSLAASAVDIDPLVGVETAIELLSDGERPAEYAVALLAGARRLGAVDPDRADALLARAAPLIEVLQVPDLTWQLHHLSGRSARRSGDRDRAGAEFDLAVAALDAIRSTIDTDRSRRQFDDARRSAADDMIDLLLDAGEVDRAFELADSMHGRGLVEAMEGESRTADDAAVRSELLATYDRLLSARGPAVEELTARARRLERDAAPAPTAGSPVAVFGDPVAGPPDRTICFQVIDHEVLAFVGGESGTRVVRKVCETSRIERLLSQLVVQWRRFEHPQVVARHVDLVRQATVDVLGELHACLLEPLASHLPESGSLNFVTDGAIGAVPFGALHDGRQHLIQRFAIRQIPSVGVDRILRTRRRPNATVLAMGTVDDLAPLATVEAGRVGEAWTASGGRGVVLRDGDATADVLLAQAAEHDVVHVASHGIFRDDSPEFSAIRLADRWVTAAEISRLRLDGQLVVLSACDTGRRHSSGPLRDVVGLPRALLAAGARGVIASRWPADDAATTALMSVLHHGLARGETDAEALRHAQLATRVTHPHPYYWASTVLVGGTG
ncbi:CHAT domain-containing protein [Ilumatobacter sp.]|uniref:CHAT domain-containing protein n=1 Tax=Ilumatobacter sp. TaxID=1967498 RepID=UPI003AF8730C